MIKNNLSWNCAECDHSILGVMKDESMCLCVRKKPPESFRGKEQAACIDFDLRPELVEFCGRCNSWTRNAKSIWGRCRVFLADYSENGSACAYFTKRKEPANPKYRDIPIENADGSRYAESIGMDHWMRKADFVGFRYADGTIYSGSTRMYDQDSIGGFKFERAVAVVVENL